MGSGGSRAKVYISSLVAAYVYGSDEYHHTVFRNLVDEADPGHSPNRGPLLNIEARYSGLDVSGLAVPPHEAEPSHQISACREVYKEKLARASANLDRRLSSIRLNHTSLGQ